MSEPSSLWSTIHRTSSSASPIRRYWTRLVHLTECADDLPRVREPR